MTRTRLLLLVALAVVLGTTAPALAATSTSTDSSSSAVSTPSFGLGNAEQNALTTATTPAVSSNSSSSSTGGGGLSTGDGIAIGAVTLGVILAIAFFVWRDARLHTRRDPDVSDDPFADKRKGSKAPPRSRKLTPAERKRRKRGRAPRGRA